MQWRSQSLTVGRAQPGPLTALIGYLNVILEFFQIFIGRAQPTFGLASALPWLRLCLCEYCTHVSK